MWTLPNDIAWYCHAIPISIVSAINVLHFPKFAIFTATNVENIPKENVIITSGRVDVFDVLCQSFHRDSCERNHKILNYMTWHCGHIGSSDCITGGLTNIVDILTKHISIRCDTFLWWNFLASTYLWHQNDAQGSWLTPSSSHGGWTFVCKIVKKKNVIKLKMSGTSIAQTILNKIHDLFPLSFRIFFRAKFKQHIFESLETSRNWSSKVHGTAHKP